MSRSQEADLMKNLSALEKRKLLRHIEHSHQGSPKKTQQHQPSVAKSYNATPKPFNGEKPKAPQPTKSFSRWGPGASSNGNSAASNVIKPVRAPYGKSNNENDVVIPQLNQAHVKMFNEKSSPVNKFKDPVKKPVTPVNRNFQIPTKSNINKPSSNSPKIGSNVVVKSTPSVTPAFNVALKPTPKISSTSNAQSNFVPKVTPSSNKPSSAYAGINSVSSGAPFQKQVNPTRPTSDYSNKKSEDRVFPPKPSQVASANKKPMPKPAVVNSPPAQQNVAPSKQPSSPPVPSQGSVSPRPQSGATKPTVPWQQRAEPLSKDKNSTKGSPPTAVVAPIQDRSKPVATSNLQKSAEKARQRSVSSPVIPKKNDVVSYSSSSENVILPELAITKPAKTNESKPKRSLSEIPNAVPQSKDASSKNVKLGHNFQPHELKEWVNWCDACGSVILSLFGKCVSCTKCKMVCHVKCAMAVSLTCEADQKVRSMTLTDTALSYYKTIVQETKDESTLKEYNTIQRVISIEEVQERIEEFNQTAKRNQQMTLQEDGETFRGFIRVSMNLTRPVSVVDTSKTTRKPAHPKKASFYIDKGALKALNVTSDTTAEQVVQALLLKYNIIDNPMKFALFEKQVREEGHVILRKMLPRERPLFLRLLWGNGNSDKRGFILQENESRDIHWESFSIAELQMFIKILDKEENDYIIEIKRKYKNKAKDIKNAIDYQTKKASS